MADEQYQPMVPEHGASPAEKIKSTDGQTEDERKVVALAEKIFAKNKRARAKHDKDWVTWTRYFMGDQWSQKRPSYRHSEVLNIVASNIRSIVPILTDPQPQVQTIPEDPTDFEFSEIMNQVISSKWERENFNMIMAESVVDACAIGTAIGTVPWVDSLADGLGDYTFETIDPAHAFPAPNARDANDRRGLTFCIAEPVDVSELKEEYKDHPNKDKIKPDLSDAITYSSFMDEAQEFQFKSPVDNRLVSADSRSAINGNPDLVLKLTVYIMSDEVISKKDCITDSQTGEKTEIEEHVKKYPKGRKIVCAGKILLEDGELEYDDGKYPIARLVNDIIPRSFWGESEIKNQKSPQDIANKLMSYLLDYLIIMGNPVWVIDSEAQVDVDNITNEPGMILLKKKGAEARREQGVSPPPFIMNTLQWVMSDVFAKISGQNDVSQGLLSQTNLSGEAISQMTEAAQTRLRAKARNLDAYLQQVGQMMVSRILQYYNLPRIVRITGKDGEAAKYFRFSVEQQPVIGADGQPVMDGDKPRTQRVANYQQFIRDEQSGVVSEGPVKQLPIKGNLDIRITTGTALPFMKAKRDTQAERFFDKGILDAEDLLGTIEYPKRERILQKWKQRQALAAQPPQGEAPGGAPAPAPAV